MSGSCRFAFAVHILAMLAYRQSTGATSDIIAASVNTNPVVIRRLLTVLRQAGFITTRKGAGAGSRLARQPSEITLRDVYRVVESAAFSLFHSHALNRRCPVARQMEVIFHQVSLSAQAALEEALSQFTLDDVLQAVHSDSTASANRQLRPRKTK